MLRKIALTLVAILLIALVAIFALRPDPDQPAPLRIAEPTTSRLTTEGEYVGFNDVNGARAWLGLPFAAPPVDELRWVEPQPPERHEGIKEALTFGEPCVQFPNPTLRTEYAASEGIVGSEDCLYLNIWSPPNVIDAPVMFWIHGGGNSVGEAATYDGSVLAAKHRVVVVTTNYRLGILGWFNHQDLLALHEQSTGNFAILDLIQALQWVRDNIRAFGGNPDNITVFGESAGGFNTLSLMATKLADGLFHRAISQSGGFGINDPATGYALASEGGHTNSAPEIINRLLVADGTVTNNEEAFEKQSNWSPSELDSYLASKSTVDLLATIGDNRGGMFDFPSGFGDSYVFPLASSEEIFSDPTKFNNVPVVLGTNRDEPTLFMMQAPQYVDTWFGVIPRIKNENDYRRIAYYGAQAWKERGVDRIASALRSGGHLDVFAYRFDWDEQASAFFFDLSVAIGAGHAIEIPFVFGTAGGIDALSALYPNDEAQIGLSDSMMSYWAEFAHNGDPGRGRDGQEVQWTRFGEENQTSILLDTTQDGGIRMMSELVTMAALREEFLSDDSFEDHDAYCNTYVNTFRGTSVYRAEDLAQIGCDHINPDEVGWY